MNRLDLETRRQIKKYGQGPVDAGRYSPPVVTDVEPRPIFGDPDLDHVSTSYVERANLTMRMNMRRFTRLTNASQSVSRCTSTPSRCTSCTTTSAAFT